MGRITGTVFVRFDGKLRSVRLISGRGGAEWGGGGWRGKATEW